MVWNTNVGRNVPTEYNDGFMLLLTRSLAPWSSTLASEIPSMCQTNTRKIRPCTLGPATRTKMLLTSIYNSYHLPSLSSIPLSDDRRIDADDTVETFNSNTKVMLLSQNS